METTGAVKDFTGEGIMALFAAPEVLEDAPLRARRAALLIHDRLAPSHSQSKPNTACDRRCGSASIRTSRANRPRSMASLVRLASRNLRPRSRWRRLGTDYLAADARTANGNTELSL